MRISTDSFFSFTILQKIQSITRNSSLANTLCTTVVNDGMKESNCDYTSSACIC